VQLTLNHIHCDWNPEFA